MLIREEKRRDGNRLVSDGGESSEGSRARPALQGDRCLSICIYLYLYTSTYLCDYKCVYLPKSVCVYVRALVHKIYVLYIYACVCVLCLLSPISIPLLIFPVVKQYGNE